MVIRKKKSEWPVYVGIGVLILALLGIGGGFAWYRFGHESIQLDKETFCPLKKGVPNPIGHTVVFIDETDPLTDLNSDYLQARLNGEMKQTEPGTLINIYRFDEELTVNREPSFKQCKPRDGSDADSLTENEKLMRKRFNEKFKKPITETLNNISKRKESAKYSPLFEQLQFISVNAFQKWNVDGAKKLIIFSDMLHNTKEFSMYRAGNGLDYKKFAKTNYGVTTKTNLIGVEVELHYFITKPSLQTNRNVNFWKEYFKACGASVVLVTNGR